MDPAQEARVKKYAYNFSFALRELNADVQRIALIFVVVGMMNDDDDMKDYQLSFLLFLSDKEIRTHRAPSPPVFN